MENSKLIRKTKDRVEDNAYSGGLPSLLFSKPQKSSTNTRSLICSLKMVCSLVD